MRNWPNIIITALAILAVSVIVGAVAFTAFQQTFPPVTVPPQPANMIANCPTLTISAATPGNGSVVAKCGAQNAFTVQNAAVTATPSFTITTSNATGTATVGLSVIVSGFACSSGVPLRSGFQSELGAGFYDYCVNYSFPASGGTIDAFTVSWA